MSTIVEQDQVFAIAQEVFAAMIDGDEGLLVPLEGDLPTFHDPVVAWVDLHGDLAARSALTTEMAVAHDLARALLGMGEDEEVSRADLEDAFGEVANVVGGNIKSLLPTQGTLGLPQVSDALPDVSGASPVHELRLAWRGRPIVVTTWVFL
ncbi:chemotaxis protein CheX [Cellulomonas soli]|uniref:chemotaxis protein CheX n=1 Tax=Cellulomonas soli TaxID=931535 RepID=UPI003F83DB53